MEKTYAKLYISSKQGISPAEIYFLAGSNLCLVNNLKRFSERNYLAEVEFKEYKNVLDMIKADKSYRGKDIQVRRVFKSMLLKKRWLKEPKQSFLIEVITGVEGLIKKPINVKVVGDGTWVKALTKRWQETLDNPQKYKEMGINPVVDITKDGKLKLHVVKTYNHILTFFDKNIDNLVEK